MAEAPFPRPVIFIATRCAGVAGFAMELRVLLEELSRFSICPGPHPNLFWLKMPGFESATSIENGLLVDPDAVTISVAGL